MIIRRPPDIRASEITPKSVYLRRREFLGGAAALGLAAALPFDPAWAALDGRKKPVLDRRAADAAQGHHDLQQLLRVRHRQGRSGRRTPHTLKTDAVDGQGRRPGRQAGATTISTTSSSPSRSRSASTACAASKAGRWSSRGSAFRSPSVLKRVEPQSSAKYVAFETLVRPAEMPGQTRLVPGAAVALRRRACGSTKRCIR